jgi:hypothetical protein
MICTSIRHCNAGKHCITCSHCLIKGSATVNGKVWQWEYQPFYGPLFVGKRGEPLSRQPGSRNPVWPEFYKWLAGQEKGGIKG